MTFSLTIGGSRKDAPYHPLTDDEAKAFDAATKAFGESLAAAGLRGSISGSRPGTQAEYEARPRLTSKGRAEALDTSSTSISLTF